jgi:tRNA threonylcarbamoyladenosine biosynthesis protein TsaE
MQKRLENLEQLGEEAATFVRGLRPAEAGATLVTLSGELGAGKTAFTKAAAAALGVEESVTSPTFVLEKMYSLPAGSAFKQLIHIDAYRLEDGATLAPLGFAELMRHTANLVMLEWPERVESELPAAQVKIMLEALPDGARTISYV